MTSRAKEELFIAANDRGIVLQEVQCSGRKWRGEMRDALYPVRETERFSYCDAEEAVRRVVAYSGGRTIWAADHPGLAGALAPLRAPANTPRAPEFQIVEVPGDSQEDYDSGFNDGLAVGLKLPATAPLVPLAAPDQTLVNQQRDRIAELKAETERLTYDLKIAKGAIHKLEAATLGQDATLNDLRLSRDVWFERARKYEDLVNEHATTIASIETLINRATDGRNP